jgi:outer membrane protein TolC
VAVLEARYVLSDAIGLTVDSPGEAPLASQDFLDDFEYAVAPDAARERATSRRWDLQAAGHLVEAAEILTDAAQFDLKPRIDLFARAGLSTLYESPIFKAFPEELDEPEPDTFTHFYSPRGTIRSFDSKWQPFFAVGITIDLPFGNNRSKGALQRERAALRSNTIQETDLGRVIESNVVSVMGALRRARQVVERRSESVALMEQTLQSTLTRYRNGDVSLIDTLTTEEDLTNERIQLAISQQAYWSLVARLRFEVGDIIELVEENTPREAVEFDAGEFVRGQ